MNNLEKRIKALEAMTPEAQRPASIIIEGGGPNDWRHANVGNAVFWIRDDESVLAFRARVMEVAWREQQTAIFGGCLIRDLPMAATATESE
jgi:hypothetical protein